MSIKIKFENNKDQLALIQAMASSDKAKAYEAQAQVANYVGPVLNEFMDKAPILSNLFERLPFGIDKSASIPLALYSDITDEDFIKIYTTSMAGGLASNQVVLNTSELKVASYTLMAAYHFDSKYARDSRLDVVSKTFGRLGQDILLKQERTSANIILGTLADNAANQLVAGTTTKLVIADFNNLLLKGQRVNTAWQGGTPVGAAGGITDLWLSPERMADLREMAYNPVSTTSSDGVTAPQEVRAALFKGAGLANFYGFVLHQVNELGKNQSFTQAFDAQYSGTFDSAADDLVLGLDLSRESLFRVVGQYEGVSTDLNIQVDDQWKTRERKIGWFGEMEEGRVCLDKRTIYGLRIASATR